MFVSVIFWGFVDMMLYQIPPQPGGATIAFNFETVACFGTPLLTPVPILSIIRTPEFFLFVRIMFSLYTMMACGICGNSAATTTETLVREVTRTDDVSRVQRALRGCDDSKDYQVKEIGEEGRGGYSEWSMVCQPHFTNWLTYRSVSLALRDHIRDIRHAAPKFHKFQTSTTSTADSQPATSRTIYALIRRRCGWMKGDHRAEGADTGEERRGATDVQTGKSVSHCLCSVVDLPGTRLSQPTVMND